MLIFVARRLLACIPLLLVTSFIVFSLVHLAPGSPESVLLGGKNVDAETLAAVRARYHLDDPFLTQYWLWLRAVLTGDLGQSIVFRDSVVSVIGARVGATLELAAYAFFLVMVFGLAAGTAAGVTAGRPTERVISAVTLVGASVSTYVSGILLITIFSVSLGWFPIFGLGGGGLDRLYHLTLPAIALAIALTALVARTTSASLAGALRMEFIETARSRGLPEYRVVLKHGLRSALIPVVTLTGLVFGYLMTGAVLVEYTFGLNGLGALLVQAVKTGDFAVVQGITLLFVLAFVLINLVVDVLYAVVDPRIRLTAARP